MSNKKLNDCYFFYYSTCLKADACTYRHEPTALGNETMCPLWRENRCSDVHCPMRHMEMKKDRKTIQCYWETQPGGCRKPHCVFHHSKPREELDKTRDDLIKTYVGRRGGDFVPTNHPHANVSLNSYMNTYNGMALGNRGP